MTDHVIRSREDIFDTLHMLRVNSRLDQQEVADELGARQQHVSRWEGAGLASVPRFETLVRLLDFYGYELVIREKSS